MRKLLLGIAILSALNGCKKEEIASPETADTKKLPEIRTGYFHRERITYEVRDTVGIVDGDIIVPLSQIYKTPPTTIQSTGYTSSFNLWPYNTVYYTLKSDLPATLVAEINAAIAEFDSKTNIRFVPKPELASDYVEFGLLTSGLADGTSEIGRKGNKQSLLLKRPVKAGLIIHEMCHALGILHEHTRADRDNYLTVHSENIAPGYKHNFEKSTSNNTEQSEGGLDFKSIMLYGPKFFSVNGQPTLTKKDGTTYEIQSKGLSAGDIAFLNRLYPVDNSARVKSLTAFSPLSPGIANGTPSVVFKITFSEPVKKVDVNDFEISKPGATGTLSGVTGSGSEYYVTISNVKTNPYTINQSSNGSVFSMFKASVFSILNLMQPLKLDLKAGSDITDANGKYIKDRIPGYTAGTGFVVLGK